MSVSDFQLLRSFICQEVLARSKPHPMAEALRMPGGQLAPEPLRLWAALDRFYPTELIREVAWQPIAHDWGTVIVHPMAQVLEDMCTRAIWRDLERAEELDDFNRRWLAFYRKVAARHVPLYPGMGVIIERRGELPDSILWFGPDDELTIIYYQQDAFPRTQPFVPWLLELFEPG